MQIGRNLALLGEWFLDPAVASCQATADGAAGPKSVTSAGPAAPPSAASWRVRKVTGFVVRPGRSGADGRRWSPNPWLQVSLMHGGQQRADR